jgi:FKBP-type peptidyl-prolyl cis-trans isomerase FkpA
MQMSSVKIIVVAALAAIFATSCLNVDEDEKVYTAAEEIHLREAYLDSLVSRGHDIDTTSLGVYYITIEEGDGEFAKTGDTLTVGYSGYYIDGRMFDSSEIYYADGKMTFILENPPMIEGWDNGMKVMNKDAMVQLIIPSELAYGDEWYGNVPPYQTLIFVIKLYDIKPS